jgi:hypothetical protein
VNREEPAIDAENAVYLKRMNSLQALVGRMLHYDALRGRCEEFAVLRNPGCSTCR